VRSGGRQERVAVGDVFELDRVAGKPGSTLQLPALLLVDGETVTSDAESLGGVTVTAEVVDHTKGPKIIIQKYKNKTGYKKRQGHRQRLTQVKITGIDTAKPLAVETAPVAAEPVLTAPIETNPVVTEPVVTEPVVTEAVVTEPTIDDTSRTETGE